MTILVTGATGNIGGEVIKHLRERQAPIRALVRDRHKAADLAAQGIELAQGDLNHPESLDAALQGCDKALLVMPNHPQQVELECQFIDAAKRAGVRHLVKLSVLRAGEIPSTFQQWHRQIEQHLEASGMAWTHLRPNMFMQNMRWFIQTMAQQGTLYHSIDNTVPISHVDARDVSAVAALCLSEAGHEHKAYELTGAAAITFDRVVEDFARALNRSVNYVRVAPADMKVARLANGEPEWYLDAEAELFACWQDGAGTAITTTVADLLNRSPATFTAFAQDYVSTHATELGVST
jgi:uncharacterized protein YbjT (DUF2867 family)